MPDVDEEIREILEFNLQFLRQDSNDENRYYVGPELLTALAWAVTSIALPVLLAGANEVVKSKVQAWLKQRRQDEIAERLAQAAIEDPAQGTAEAIKQIEDYLSSRGWPLPMAHSDATQIVDILKTRLK